MPLNGTEILVLAAKTMRMTDQQALTYFESKGAKISRTTYYRTLGTLHTKTKNRMYEICKNFRELHMERIDNLRQVETEYWNNYKSTKTIIKMQKRDVEGTDGKGNPTFTKEEVLQQIEVPLEPMEKQRILKDIVELQPYISTYEEATARIMEDSIKQFATEENIDISNLGI